MNTPIAAEKLNNALDLALSNVGNNAPLCVAYSGGKDSTALLHCAARLAPERPVRALHINHQLQTHADAWAEHCRRVASRLSIICDVVSVDVGDEGGLEAAARSARYRVFAKALRDDEILLQAHHANDQLETLLQRLMRGTGQAGLAGIPATRPLGKGRLIRPFLEVPASALQAYCREFDLTWIEDPSNQETDRDRNYLRHTVIPQLLSRWPSGLRCASRAALLVHESNEREAQTLSEHLKNGCCEGVFDLQYWRALPELWQAPLLRAYLQQQAPDSSPPNARWLMQRVRELRVLRHDSQWCAQFSGAWLRSYRDQVFFDRGRLPPPQACWQAETLRWGDQTLSKQWLRERGVCVAQEETLRVVRRTGGEQLQLPGRRHRVALSDWAQSVAMPPWERVRLALVYQNDELVALYGHLIWPGANASTR